MNKEQQELLDEAYENYLNNFIEPVCPPNLDVQPSYYEPMTKEWFVKSAKEKDLRGKEFSERWGLKIEERELSLEERSIIAKSNHYEVSQNIKRFVRVDEDRTLHKNLDEINIPTKLITITYNDKTIESYEGNINKE
jgi:hypothetical protein